MKQSPVPIKLAMLAALALPLTASAAAPAVIEGKDGWLFAGWERAEKVDQPALAANIALLQDAQKQLAAHKVNLLLIVVPAKATFYPQRLPASDTPTAELAGRYAAVLAQLQQAGLTTFDDRVPLHSIDKAPQTAFYRADYHWTAWAAEASADAAAQLITKTWPLPASSSPGNVLGEWTNDRHYGDLAINFMSPDDRKRIGRDTYTVRTAPDTAAAGGAGAGLLDSAPANVLVVGNSFVQPYLGFPQKLSNALGQPVGLTWNPGNISPWKTILDAVESKDFAQHKPHVIVWQLNEARLETSPDSADAWDAGSAMPAAAWRSRFGAALAR